MRIMVTGDQGYIGSVLVPILIEKGYDVIGYDNGFFTENAIASSKSEYISVKKDIRDISSSDLDGVNAVIHLAGLSNDPLGEFDPALTVSINYHSTIRMAKLAKECGVSRFVYASSQSMYGVSETEENLDEDTSVKNPITAYATAKMECRAGFASIVE